MKKFITLRQLRSSTLATATLAAAFLAACKPSNPNATSDGGGAAASAPAAPAAYEPPAPDPSLVPTRTIELNVGMDMKFNITQLTAKPDEVLKIVLHNVGTIPKAAMGHNFVLLDRTANVQDYVNAAATCASTDYFPPQYESWVLARIKLLGGGESGSTVFQVPHITGTYNFLCTFPGHYQNGAKGTLTVQN